MIFASILLVPPPRAVPPALAIRLFTNRIVVWGALLFSLAGALATGRRKFPDAIPEEVVNAVIATSLLLMLFGIARARRELALYREGMIAQARIVECRFVEGGGETFTVPELRAHWTRKLAEQEARRELAGVDGVIGCLARLLLFVSILGALVIGGILVGILWFDIPIDLNGEVIRDPGRTAPIFIRSLLIPALVAGAVFLAWGSWRLVRDRRLVPDKAQVKLPTINPDHPPKGSKPIAVESSFEFDTEHGSFRGRDRARVGPGFGSSQVEPVLYHPARDSGALLLDGQTIALRPREDGQWTPPVLGEAVSRLIPIGFLLWLGSSWLIG